MEPGKETSWFHADCQEASMFAVPVQLRLHTVLWRLCYQVKPDSSIFTYITLLVLHNTQAWKLAAM